MALGQKERPLRHLGSQGTEASPELQLRTVAQIGHDREHCPLHVTTSRGLLRWIWKGPRVMGADSCLLQAQEQMEGEKTQMITGKFCLKG